MLTVIKGGNEMDCGFTEEQIIYICHELEGLINKHTANIQKLNRHLEHHPEQAAKRMDKIYQSTSKLKTICQLLRVFAAEDTNKKRRKKVLQQIDETLAYAANLLQMTEMYLIVTDSETTSSN